MSKIKCNKCGETIKIKTMFLEKAGCENCGNSIDFTNMDALSGLKQGLMLGTAVFVGIVLFIVLLANDISLGELPELFHEMPIEIFGMLVIAVMFLVVIVAGLERVIGCRVYESYRKREEELERAAALRRNAEKTE